MAMTIVFYAIIAVFALSLLAWVANKFMNMWQAGVLVGALYFLGTLILLGQMIAVIVMDQTVMPTGLLSVFAFVLALCCCYMHFRLVGTVVAPLSAVVIILAEVGTRWLADVQCMMPLVTSFEQPWVTAATMLSTIGLAVFLAWAMLAVIAIIRKQRLNENTNQLIASVTLKMPKIVSTFGWWSLMILSFALGAYILWCHTVFGAYWLWQPFFVATAVAWLVVVVAKDIFMVR